VEAERKHNNPMYFHERELTGFDVVVSSLAMRPFVQIINLELVQGYFNTNTNSCQKY
jgi:hypothetical protein